MVALNGLAVVMVNVKVSADVKKRIAERGQQGLCLICDCQEEAMGLCSAHYHQYRAAKMELPKDRQLSYEADLLRTGHLRRSRQGRRSKGPNPFRRIAGLE